MTSQLLIVDDDQFSASYIRQALAQQQIEADVVPTASQARSALCARQADLVLLDVTLPDASGFEVGTWLRQTYADVGIVFVSGHAGISDRLRAFESGADDFLAKPVLSAELVARVRAVLRRRGAKPPAMPQWYQAGGVGLNLAQRALSLPNGRTVPLSQPEAQIMARLLARPGQMVSRADLARAVWGDARGAQPANQRALDLHLDTLRGKIEPDPLWARYVQVIRNVGARFIMPKL